MAAAAAAAGGGRHYSLRAKQEVKISPCSPLEAG